MDTLQTGSNPSNQSDGDELIEGIKLMGDQFEEARLEEEEARLGDQRDVVKDIPGMDGHEQVMPTADQIPAGMETAIRSEDGDSFETAGEDEETGNDDA